jgi:hypothetical protein
MQPHATASPCIPSENKEKVICLWGVVDQVVRGGGVDSGSCLFSFRSLATPSILFGEKEGILKGKGKKGEKGEESMHTQKPPHPQTAKNTQREPFLSSVSQFVLESARGISIIKKSKNHSAWVTIIITKMNRGDVSIFHPYISIHSTLEIYTPRPTKTKTGKGRAEKEKEQTYLMNHQKGGQPHELPPTKGGRSEWSLCGCVPSKANAILNLHVSMVSNLMEITISLKFTCK